MRNIPIPTNWFDLMGIPPSFRKISIDSYSSKGLVATGLECVMAGQSIYLHGEVGRGKSYIACYWAARWAHARMRVNEYGDPLIEGGLPRFVVYPDLLDDMKKTFGGGGYDTLMTPIRKCPLLVIDNMTPAPTGEHGAWRREEMFKIINYRFNAGLPIIVTTTTPFSKYESHEPDSASRLAGMGVQMIVRGVDRRKSA